MHRTSWLLLLLACSTSNGTRDAPIDAGDVALRPDAAPSTAADAGRDAGRPTPPLCWLRCARPEDCAGTSPDRDADNWACTDGLCVALGCKDGECEPGFACHADALGVPRCVPGCSTPGDCAGSGADASGDADNWDCEQGACVYLGCREGECTEGQRCTPLYGLGEPPTCNGACSVASECGATNLFTCVEGACRFQCNGSCDGLDPTRPAGDWVCR